MLGVVAVISLGKLYKQSGQKTSLYRHLHLREVQKMLTVWQKSFENAVVDSTVNIPTRRPPGGGGA